MTEQPQQAPQGHQQFTSAYDYLNAQLNQAGALLAKATDGRTLSFTNSVDLAAVHAELAKAGALVALAQEFQAVSKVLPDVPAALWALREALDPEVVPEVSEPVGEPLSPAQDLVGRTDGSSQG